MSPNRIVELAQIIAENTKLVDDHLTSKELPTPSFAADNPPTLLFGHGPKIDASRQAVVDATDELQALMLGPTGLLSSLFHNSLLSIHAIVRFNLCDFPDGKEEATYAELASSCGQPESETRRIFRHAMTFRIFTEPRKGVVAHTAASKRLTHGPMKAWLGFVTEELAPSAVKTVDALQKWPGAQEPNQTGFNIANGTEDLFFEEIGKEGRSKRYDEAMNWFNAAPGFETDGLVEGIEWGQFETVVDVGGNNGLLCRALARRYKGVKFVVQDRKEPIEDGRKRLEKDLRERIVFMEHDFFEVQTVRADVYLLRWVLHDWSDKYAMRILRALIPALKPGARVVLNEFVLPPPGVAGSYTEKILRTMDLSMLELHNGKERDADDWEKLFRDCDPRFMFLGITRPPMSKLGIIQAEWKP